MLTSRQPMLWSTPTTPRCVLFSLLDCPQCCAAGTSCAETQTLAGDWSRKHGVCDYLASTCVMSLLTCTGSCHTGHTDRGQTGGASGLQRKERTCVPRHMRYLGPLPIATKGGSDASCGCPFHVQHCGCRHVLTPQVDSHNNQSAFCDSGAATEVYAPAGQPQTYAIGTI